MGISCSSSSNVEKSIIPSRPNLYEEDNKTRVEVNTLRLSNWGENVEFKPSYVFTPKTKIGLCNVVKWATDNKLRIRSSGFRHTWNNVYANNGHVLISLLGLNFIETNNSASSENWNTGAGEVFRQIEYVQGCDEPDHIYCKIGSAVTNEELKRFCNETCDPFKKQKWTYPYNVIILDNTVVGTVSNMCHGAGARNKTMSDLVVEIEFVNALGNLQIVNKNSKQLKSAAGSFGLLGVITYVTLKFTKMSYTNIKPCKIDFLKAVPPPKGFLVGDLPKYLHSRFKTQSELDDFIESASKPFYDHCQNDYHAEWFWFIMKENCWVNNWKIIDEENLDQAELARVGTGNELHVRLEDLYIKSMTPMIDPNGKDFAIIRGQSESNINRLVMHNGSNLVTISDAVHFLRGSRHMKLRFLAIEIPVPMIDNKPDWSICQLAWWDAVKFIYDKYDEDKTSPINMVLEMRVLSGSDVTMAPQYGNKYTCSIEVISNLMVSHSVWQENVERLLDKWISYENHNGQRLNIRAHWAKEWDGFRFGNQSGREYVKDAYKSVLGVFKNDLCEIAKQGGYTLDDMKQCFSNDLYDDVIFS